MSTPVCDYICLADQAVAQFAGTIGNLEAADTNWVIFAMTNPLNAVMKAQQVDTSQITSGIIHAEPNQPYSGWVGEQESLLQQRQQFWQNQATPLQAGLSGAQQAVTADQNEIQTVSQIFGMVNSVVTCMQQITQGAL